MHGLTLRAPTANLFRSLDTVRSCPRTSANRGVVPLLVPISRDTFEQMIVYSATKSRFQADVLTNDISGIILRAYQARTGHTTGKSEIDSWASSLQYMDRVLTDDAIPADAGIAIEYHIPQTSKRIDFIITGKDAAQRDSAVLVELKQWSHAQLTDQDAMVRTQYQGRDTLATHPSYQAWSYKRLLEDFNQAVQTEAIQLYPCAYLHNYAHDHCMTNDFYREYIENAPVFLKNDAVKLREFIGKHVRYGDRDQILYRIDHGKIKPSKNLADQLASMLQGNEEFIMIDDQKVVYETAMKQADHKGKKRVLIVEGGPGTGKSVVAIHLLVAMTNREWVVQYVTRNSAPRKVYEAKLTGSMKKSHISNLFSGSGSFHSMDENTFDCLIVDEAHRLTAKSGMFSHLGENQVCEIIRASRFSVFFVDEDQKVTLKDIGDKDEIRRWAKKENAQVTELALESQFRCNGSNGYLAWLDNTLQIRPTANETLDTADYDFQIVDTPSELHEWVRERNREKNKARMVAGYCWKWVSKKQPQLKDIVIGNYKATWNFDSHGQSWIIHPDSVNEVGCVYTSQGLELDYVGVIVGPDLVVRNGNVVVRLDQHASGDSAIQGRKALHVTDPVGTDARLSSLIKNTYRTLMTRGQKGCYVYFVDEEARRFFQSRMDVVTPEIVPYINALPLLDLRAAADATYESLDGYFADDSNFSWQPARGGPFPKDRFLVRAEGDSMEPDIPNGALCIFRKDPGGSRNGKIVLCRIGGFAGDDPVAVIKRYRSARRPATDSIGEAKAIVLSSINEKHDDIVLTEGEHLTILGTFERLV